MQMLLLLLILTHFRFIFSQNYSIFGNDNIDRDISFLQVHC